MNDATTMLSKDRDRDNLMRSVDPYNEETASRMQAAAVYTKVPRISNTNNRQFKQDMYVRLSIPSITISLIDSDRAREIIQFCCSRTEFRAYQNKRHSDYLLNIDNFQVIFVIYLSSLLVLPLGCLCIACY